jgi:hypothetical protein
MTDDDNDTPSNPDDVDFSSGGAIWEALADKDPSFNHKNSNSFKTKLDFSKSKSKNGHKSEKEEE